MVYEVFLALCLFFFLVLLMLSLLPVCTRYFGCDIFSDSVLDWICVWFAKILVDVFKLSGHFSDGSLTFFLTIEFDCRFLNEVVIAFR